MLLAKAAEDNIVDFPASPSQPSPASADPRIVEDLARRAAHDLRAPIRQIKSFLEFLREDLGPDISSDAVRDIEHISQSANRLQTLIDGLSDLALVSAKELDLISIPISNAFHTKRSGVLVEAFPRPEPSVTGDVELLRMAWSGLQSASLRLSKAGGPVTVTVGCAEHGRVTVTASVDDPGLEAEDVRRSFAPFPSCPGHPNDPGSDLAICHRAVERMGGSMSAQPTPNGGLAIRIELAAEPS